MYFLTKIILAHVSLMLFKFFMETFYVFSGLYIMNICPYFNRRIDLTVGKDRNRRKNTHSRYFFLPHPMKTYGFVYILLLFQKIQPNGIRFERESELLR